MSDATLHSGVAIIGAILGLTVIAILVSTQSQTTGVLTKSGGALQQVLCTALKPVTGAACATSVNSTISFGGIVP